MNATMTVASPRVGKLQDADDPYKKYWLMILIGLGLTGAWLCLPLMETSVGSTRVDTSKPSFDPNAAQSLDSVDNPSGAPGVNLTIDGTSKKSKSDEPVQSMLYQAAPEAPTGVTAAGAPVASAAAASAPSLAQQLKDVADKKNPSGWAESASRGFNSPRLNGSLSGVSTARGGSSASAGVGVFGSKVAQVTFENGNSLQNISVDKPAAAGAALRKAAALSQMAAMNRSGDAAVGAGSRIFDGSKNSSISGPVSGGAGAGEYSALDTAPVNLKLNDPKLNSKEIKAPPASATPDSSGSNLGPQLAMLAATAIIGGMLPGAAGAAVISAGQMIMQDQQAQAAQRRSEANLAAAKAKGG